MRDHGWKETGASVRRAASVRGGNQNDSFVEFVRDQLAELGEVRRRAMFGGFGLYCSNTFFGIVYDERLYFKTDERSAEAYVARGMGPFQPNDRQKLRNYYEVPPEIIDDRDQLLLWAGEALRLAL